MARITAWIEAFALSIGGPGLFIIAFLDSSFLSFPEVNDLLIVLMVVNHPERMVLYATMATLGSVAGCLALYFVGRKGGERCCAKRFSGGSVERAVDLMRKYGAMALIVPALLPPPAPFKIFVLMGGVANIPLRPSSGDRVRARRPILRRGDSGRACTASRRSTTSTRTGARSRSCSALLVLAGGVAYYVWKRRRDADLNGTIRQPA